MIIYYIMFILQYKLLFSFVCIYACTAVFLCCCRFSVKKKDLYINMATEFNKETDSAVSEIVFFSDR